MMFYEQPLKIELKGSDLYVNGHKHAVSIRKLQKMQDVLFSNIAAQSEEDFNVYYMYRAVYSNIEMRYDVTFIPARMLGMEFNKTYGHYHPIADDKMSYPEVYHVLTGNALFLLQKKNSDGSVDVLVVDAKEGDVVLLPSGYGHVTVNPSAENHLVLANVVFNGFESDYSEYELNKGAAYYYTEEGLVQNTNYVVKHFDRMAASELNKKYGFSCKDLLMEFTKDPDSFMFLEKPSLLFKRS